MSAGTNPRWCDIRAMWLEAAAVDASLRASDLRVLVLLATRYANAVTGECYPAQATIADALGVGASTVKRALRRLESAGWIVVKPGNGRRRSSRYEMAISKVNAGVIPFGPRAKKGVRTDPLSRRKGGQSGAERGSIQSEKGGQSWPPNLSKEPYSESRARDAGWEPIQRYDACGDFWHTWLADEGYGGFDALPQGETDGRLTRRVPQRFPPETAVESGRVRAWLARHNVQPVREGRAAGGLENG